MNNKGTLAGCTIFITGASRGIGKSIAIKAAKDGANIVLAAKTAEPHPKLPGTIYTAAEEIVKAGGNALPCIVDVRDENQVANAVKSAVDTFGGIDIVINNASAVSLSGTLNTDMKKYDLMNQINARGTFLVSKACLPYLLKSKNPHILNICPAPNMHPFWFKNHVAYTISKYGMSMCTLGMAEEFKEQGVAVNALWPKTAIHTVAIEMLAGPDASKTSRKPDIVADAAYAIMCKDSKAITGQFFIDEDVLKKEGITDMTQYACDPTNVDNLMLDFFIDLDSTDLRIVSGGKSEPVQKSAGKIADIFYTINNNICTELVQRTNAVFQFIIKGKEEGTWFLDLKNGQGSVGKGEPSYPADAVLIMDSETFISILSGKLKPENAFMMGLLMVSGNLEKAMKVEELMISLISKL